jgi:endonuclease YncB( thermonuclease family)
VSGTEWDVESVASVTDGDTVRLIRSRAVEIDGRAFWLTDREAKGVPIRLAWVDTPERGQPGRNEARLDLESWIDRHAGTQGPLRVVCYESAGWDRLLGDLIDADGNSASQWLMTERGWPPYVRGK